MNPARIYIGHPLPYASVDDREPTIWCMDPRPGHATPKVDILIMFTSVDPLWGQGSQQRLWATAEALFRDAVPDWEPDIAAVAELGEWLASLDPMSPWARSIDDIRQIASNWGAFAESTDGTKTWTP